MRNNSTILNSNALIVCLGLVVLLLLAPGRASSNGFFCNAGESQSTNAVCHDPLSIVRNSPWLGMDRRTVANVLENQSNFAAYNWSWMPRVDGKVEVVFVAKFGPRPKDEIPTSMKGSAGRPRLKGDLTLMFVVEGRDVRLETMDLASADSQPKDPDQPKVPLWFALSMLLYGVPLA